jgi:Major capsid protein N-terminus
MESIEQTFNGSVGPSRRVTCQISRNGDLIHKVYLQAVLPDQGAGATFVPYVGLRLLKEVEIEIGGQRIDKHYSDWLYIWNELTMPKGKEDGYNLMVGDSLTATSGPFTLYVPLEFWFCRNVGLALESRAEKHHVIPICA